MKKFVKVFSKKKGNANFYNFCSEPWTDSNSSSTENSVVTNCYKGFQFDCCCYENAVVLRNNEPLKKFMCSKPSTLLENSSEFNSNDKSERMFVNNSGEVKQTQLKTPFSLDSDSSDLSIHSDVFKTKKEPIKCPNSNETKKNNNKVNSKYIINISNSKYFHIGPQKTVNINGTTMPSLQKLEALNSSYNNIGNNFNFISNLLNSKQKLSEDNITLISLYMDHRWKIFGKYLGLEEEFLEDVEERSDSRVIAVYDSLQKFVKQFPNSTLGFVTSLLKQTDQMNVIQKLAQKNIEVR